MQHRWACLKPTEYLLHRHIYRSIYIYVLSKLKKKRYFCDAILARCVGTFGWFVRTSGGRRCFIHRTCDSFQIGRPCTKVYTSTLRRCSGRNLPKFGVHQNETKNNPQLNICTSLVNCYSSSQTTTARETERRS